MLVLWFYSIVKMKNRTAFLLLIVFLSCSKTFGEYMNYYMFIFITLSQTIAKRIWMCWQNRLHKSHYDLVISLLSLKYIYIVHKYIFTFSKRHFKCHCISGANLLKGQLWHSLHPTMFCMFFNNHSMWAFLLQGRVNQPREGIAQVVIFRWAERHVSAILSAQIAHFVGLHQLELMGYVALIVSTMYMLF